MGNILDERFAYRRRVETENLHAAEMLACAESVSHWINQWVWTYSPKDPVDGQRTLAFSLFPQQAELIRWLESRETTRDDGVIEKSRDVGVSWLCVAFATHRWLFREGFAVGFGSRTLEQVDKVGDPKCLFEKVRFLLAHLPIWMLPSGYVREKHALYCKIINPVNGSTISGEGGDNIGRGGRTGLYFIDEAAFIERAELVDQSLEGNTACRIDVSTPNGPGNPFAQRRFSGKYPVFTMHWRDDERKSEQWAEKRRAKVGQVVWASQYEIDYSASIEGICIPAAWVRAAVDLLAPEAITGMIVAGLDIAEMGDDLCVFFPRRGPLALAPTSWKETNTTETAWRARDLAVTIDARTVLYDAGGCGAGIRGTWSTPETPLPFETVPINFGGSPSDVSWPDGQTGKEKFKNRRAEMWWRLRIRFEKSYEFRAKQIQHPVEEMISIPNHPELIAELSQPLIVHSATGKIQLESKINMRARGVKSPNYADALALAYAGDDCDWGDLMAGHESDSIVAKMFKAMDGTDDESPRERDRRLEEQDDGDQSFFGKIDGMSF